MGDDLKSGRRPTILLVCTGNLCRSPMAVGLWREKLRREGMGDKYQVRSAGIWAAEGLPAAAYAIQVMAERGIDISHHRGHNLTLEDVEEADLILTMTKSHKEIITNQYPQAAGKTYLLSEMVGRKYDISDPYGSSLALYRSRCRFGGRAALPPPEGCGGEALRFWPAFSRQEELHRR